MTRSAFVSLVSFASLLLAAATRPAAAGVDVRGAGVAGATDIPAPPQFHEVRDFIEEKIQERAVPSVAVAVVKDDKLVWARGFGLANIAEKRRATSNTIYRLASISKPLTATGLMVLADRGKIDLDAPANRYLAEARLRAHIGSAREITVRRLANHTGGLPVHWNFFYPGEAPPPMAETLRRYGFAATRPGTDWEYSNLAFGVLGHITARVSGKPWGEFMEEMVYDPLRMFRTSHRIRPGKEADAAVQYRRSDGEFTKVEHYEFDHPGASVVCSSVRDLVRFTRMHWHDGELDGVRVLSAKSARAMRALSSQRSPGSESGTGIGWAVDKSRGQRSFAHSGGMPGVSTMLRAYPEPRAAFIVLTNTANRSVTRGISGRIARALFPDASSGESADGGAPAENEALNTFAGTWRGHADHFAGPIPLELDLKADGSGALRLQGETLPPLCNVRVAGRRLFAATKGLLAARPTYKAKPALELRLTRAREKLTGVLVALGKNTFALSHWVSLEKVEENINDANANADADAGTGESAGADADARGKDAPGAFDVLIRGGRVVDGTGAPWFRADVGIRSGKITAIGQLGGQAARQTLDASGLVVAPGFTDMMGQTATPFLRSRHKGVGLNLLAQGITTILAGEGVSAAPLSEADAGKAGWRTMREYLDALNEAGMPLNVAQTVGHTQVRRIVVGERDREVTPADMERMKGLVKEAMEAGAVGLSTALIYPPAVYASSEEIGALARVSGSYGGRYFTHMRNEGDRLLEAIDEALEIGRKGESAVHIFHLKAAGRANWPKMARAIARIRAARAAGQDVKADIYPYVNNGLSLRALVHPRHFTEGYAAFRERLGEASFRAEVRREMEEGEGWENWFRHMGYDWKQLVLGDIFDEKYHEYRGMSLEAAARRAGKEPWPFFFELLGARAFVLPRSMTESNKILAMRQDFVAFCTDVGPTNGSRIKSHPRAYGSFPRVLARYVRELGALSLERAVQKMAALGANQVLAFDRGRIAVGLAADLVVFDGDRVADRATFSVPDQLSEGVKHVLVNGVLVLRDAEPTGERPGRVLRGPGYVPPKARREGEEARASK